MNNNDMASSSELLIGGVGALIAPADFALIKGHFAFVCRDADGNIKWEDDFANHITTEGVNYLLQQGLSGSGYTAAWYMGLISSTSFTACATTDIAAQINGTNGWKEVNASTYPPDYSSGTRLTTAWSAASANTKQLSAGLVFTAAYAGTIQGAFISSIATKAATTGTLFCAGAFGLSKTVAVNDTLTVNYSAIITPA